ncbi:hypothetical protein [Weissella paramesenteroides]|uniref:Uncharacterized protein n=1 Tax=Weissella paramesenteroides ATCC 33313 TaxID=585506 RepID=C5R855_WEIPA|nr:hypothetical protein [Weissella paramesenteroides]EER75639.1 hypothetical protein HMPREF0877_0150 [Weissella paramesenteroides ATCC 33313]
MGDYDVGTMGPSKIHTGKFYKASELNLTAVVERPAQGKSTGYNDERNITKRAEKLRNERERRLKRFRELVLQNANYLQIYNELNVGISTLDQYAKDLDLFPAFTKIKNRYFK